MRLLSLLIAVLIFTITVLSPSAFASYGFGPQLYKSGYEYGQGIYFAPYHVIVYAQPDETADVVEDITWQHGDGEGFQVYSNLHNKMIPANKPFFCQYPALDVAMMAVVSDNGDGWVEVTYDQASKKTGWVKLWPDSKDGAKPADKSGKPYPDFFGHFLTWMDFMKYNATAHGIYWLSGVSDYQRGIRTSDKDDAPLINVIALRDVKVRYIRGNWMLVEALDFEHNSPIGWIRWRDNDGNLLVFPNFSGQETPLMVTTGSSF